MTNTNKRGGDPPGFIVSDVLDYPQFYQMTAKGGRSHRSQEQHRLYHHREEDDCEGGGWNHHSSCQTLTTATSSSTASHVPMEIFVRQKDNDLDFSTHSCPPSNHGRCSSMEHYMMNNNSLSSPSYHGTTNTNGSPRKIRHASRTASTRQRRQQHHDDDEELDAIFEIGGTEQRRLSSRSYNYNSQSK